MKWKFRTVASLPKEERTRPVSATETAYLRPDAGTLNCIDWRDLEREIAAWEGLAREASEPNPFFESWYLLPALRHLPGSDQVGILRFERGGRLTGLLPVLREKRYYRWPVPQISSWLHANCFCGAPLVARGSEREFWRAMLEWADRSPGAALFMHLRAMPLGTPLHRALEDELTQQNRLVELVHLEHRAMLASNLAPQAYLDASLSTKKRKELRRQAKRLADEGELAVIRQGDAEGIAAWCDAFLSLETSGWKGKAGSALACDPATQALFRESLEGAASCARLERLTLTLDGRPLAMLATFLAPPGAFSYKTAFDEAYARFSPGVLLQRENLEMLARQDIDWTDSCAAADHPMIDHFWRERRPVGRLSIAIGGRLRRAAFRQFVRAETARNPSGTSS
ncbi:GNAT family N-acetyltransferase [Novosphingobium sp. KN65.2]|uniref:GNAT family N-acetyltransferase n=1 Tax=Novosphingobium sp. KN65.2 TaxID=1478134 RepID=UPI001E33804E|nr:GNAT family N-acetyltransferase [Novosphingobium sp. KN65.2]